MVKLGEFGKERKKMTFKEWIESGLKKEGIYPVNVLFPPSKYPSFTLIFDAEDVEVRLSIKADKFKEALSTLGVAVGKRNLPSILLIIDKNSYGLDVDVDNPFNMLVWKGSYWKLETENQDDDSISF
jgi:hypothetical protein